MVTFTLCLYQWDPVCPDVINGIIVIAGKKYTSLVPIHRKRRIVRSSLTDSQSLG